MNQTETPAKPAKKNQQQPIGEENGPNSEPAVESKNDNSEDRQKQNLPPVSRILANLFKSIAIEESEVSLFVLILIRFVTDWKTKTRPCSS